MILRILSLIVLLAVLSGGTWYLFRDTPQKKVHRWRQSAEYFFDQAGDLERAEEFTRRILKMFPRSPPDLFFQARILERRGTSSSLREAIEIYDRLLAGDNPGFLPANLQKSRLYRALGRFVEAQGAALSVVDERPFEATMELGSAALGAFNLPEALHLFQRAYREFAAGSAEKARALEATAAVYGQQILQLETRSSAPEAAAAVEEITARTRASLDEALELLAGIEREEPENRISTRLWLARLYDKRGQVRDTAKGERPCYDGAVLLEQRAEQDARQQRRVAAADEYNARLLQVRIGALQLEALESEKDLLPDRTPAGVAALRASVEEHFAKGLTLSAEKGNELLSSGPLTTAAEEDDELAASPDLSIKPRREYALLLIAVAKAYLGSEEFGKILADSSSLELSSRVAGARLCPDPETSGVFSVITGFAHARAQEIEVAKDIFRQYIEAAGDRRAAAALDLADQCSIVLPGSPLVFEYLKRHEHASGRPMELLGRKIRLLLRARESGALAEEASRRLDALLEPPAEGIASSDLLTLARLTKELKGRDSAIESLRQASRRFPGEPQLRTALADLLFEKGMEIEQPPGSPEAAVPFWKEALQGYLALFVANPVESQDVLRRARYLVLRLEGQPGPLALAPLLMGAFRGAPANELERFTLALGALLAGKYGTALEKASELGERPVFEPFLSFLKGACLVEIAKDELGPGRPISLAGGRLGEAAAQFAKHADSARPDYFPASEVELLTLELQAVRQEDDVPDELLGRIEKLTALKTIEHHGHWLLARALEHRFRRRYQDATTSNADLGNSLRRLQGALRRAIQRRPDFVPAHILLSSSHLLSERMEMAGNQRRQLAPPAYDKAINALKAVPNPDERVYRILAATLREAAGPLAEEERRSEEARRSEARLREARLYLEALNLARPDVELAKSLLENYLAGRDYDSLLFLCPPEPDQTGSTPGAAHGALDPELEKKLDALEEPRLEGYRLPLLVQLLREARETSTSPEAARRTILARLRGRLGELDDFEALGYFFLAQYHADKLPAAALASERQEILRRKIQLYRRCIAAYEAKGLPVPIEPINNLAWYLSERPEKEDREEALLLMKQAIERIYGREDDRVPLDVRDTHAWVLFRAGSLTEAEEKYRALTHGLRPPGSSWARYAYRHASVLHELKRYEEAMRLVELALDAGNFEEKSEARALRAEIREASRRSAGEGTSSRSR
jgi:tetratricopeptide (TPR) repeat protein